MTPSEHGSDLTDSAGDAPAPKQKAKRKRRGRKGTPPHPKGKKKTVRPTNAEMELRVLEVTRLLVRGKRPRQIRQYVAENHADWGDVSIRTIGRYIATATAELSRIADEPRAVAKGKIRARYELVIAKAAKAGQWEVVNRATRNLARLDGLEPGIRVHHEGSVASTVSGTVEHVHSSAGTIEERASRVSDLFALASKRKSAAQVAADRN